MVTVERQVLFNRSWLLRLFFEFFDGDKGAGLGAGHRTGWRGLVVKLIQFYGDHDL